MEVWVVVEPIRSRASGPVSNSRTRDFGFVTLKCYRITEIIDDWSDPEVPRAVVMVVMMKTVGLRTVWHSRAPVVFSTPLISLASIIVVSKYRQSWWASVGSNLRSYVRSRPRASSWPSVIVRSISLVSWASVVVPSASLVSWAPVSHLSTIFWASAIPWATISMSTIPRWSCLWVKQSVSMDSLNTMCSTSNTDTHTPLHT